MRFLLGAVALTIVVFGVIAVTQRISLLKALDISSARHYLVPDPANRYSEPTPT